MASIPCEIQMELVQRPAFAAQMEGRQILAQLKASDCL